MSGQQGDRWAFKGKLEYDQLVFRAIDALSLAEADALRFGGIASWKMLMMQGSQYIDLICVVIREMDEVYRTRREEIIKDASLNDLDKDRKLFEAALSALARNKVIDLTKYFKDRV
jgi:hypothetical protein